MQRQDTQPVEGWRRGRARRKQLQIIARLIIVGVVGTQGALLVWGMGLLATNRYRDQLEHAEQIRSAQTVVERLNTYNSDVSGLASGCRLGHSPARYRTGTG